MMQTEIGQILSLVGFFSLLSWILSPQFRELLNQWLNQWRSDIGNLFDPYCYVDVPEFESGGSNPNKVFIDVKRYLTKPNASEISAQKLTVFCSKFSPAFGETVVESFQGVTVWWSYHIQYVCKNDLTEKRWFTLKVAKPSKYILSAYFDHIANKAAELKNTTNNSGSGTESEGTNNSGSGSETGVLRIGWFIKPFTHQTICQWRQPLGSHGGGLLQHLCWFVMFLPHASVPFVMWN